MNLKNNVNTTINSLLLLNFFNNKYFIKREVITVTVSLHSTDFTGLRHFSVN